MNGEIKQSFVAAFLVVVFSSLIPPLQQVLIHAQAEKGVVTITFDDGWLNQYQNAYPLMKARNMVGTFYVISDCVRDISGDPNKMSFAELLDLQDNGCEIGSHSKTHPSFTSLSESEIREECLASKLALESHGLEVNNFAYPYGDTNDYVDSIVDDYYESGRTASGDILQIPWTIFRLCAYRPPEGNIDDFIPLKNKVDEVAEKKGWLIVFFHHIIPSDDDFDFATSIDEFEKFLDYVLEKDLSVLTVNQVLNMSSSTENATMTKTSLSVQAPSSATVGQTVTVKGTLTGAYSPSYVLTGAVQNAPIVLTTTWGLALRTTTTTSGELTFTFNAPSTEGTHEITVEFEGDMYFASSRHVLSIVVSKPPTVQNLLLNPSVEVDNDGNGIPDYWQNGVSTSVQASCEWVSDAHSGVKGVKITITYNPSVGQCSGANWRQSTWKFKVGKTYKLRVWYKSSVESGVSLYA